MKPVIVEKQEFSVVGLRYHGKNERGEIPAMWAKFWSRVNEIGTWSNRGQCFGVCRDAGKTGIDYIACVEVSTLDSVPEGMFGMVIPANRYAIFTHHGHVDRIHYTYQSAGQWLAANGYEWSRSAPDFELYDERFNPNDMENSDLDIYIPIKP